MFEWMFLPHWFLISTAALIGLLFGSFANVIIWRLPRGESVVFPRSHCVKCQTLIPWYDNLPLVSWLLLKGRCRKCHLRIHWRYPIVECLMGFLFAAVFSYYHSSWVTMIELLIFVFGLVTVSFIDLDHMILPDEFTLSGIVLGLLGALINPDRTFMAALAGVVMGGGFLWAIAYIYLTLRHQEGMGGGDIKLLAWIGAVLGWQAVPFVILVSSLSGSVAGLLLIVFGRAGLKASIPFGPYLAWAALLYIFGGQHLGEWYLSLFFH